MNTTAEPTATPVVKVPTDRTAPAGHAGRLLSALIVAQTLRGRAIRRRAGLTRAEYATAWNWLTGTGWVRTNRTTTGGVCVVLCPAQMGGQTRAQS